MKTEMKYGMMVLLMMAAGFHSALGADPDTQKPSDNTDQSSAQIKIPAKDSPEYWNVRSEAISEFLPFLTKKRSEMKSDQQLLEDFLLKSGKESEFAAKNIPVPDDPKVYFEILQIGQGLKDMNIAEPKKRPSWDEIMDIVMQHVIFEGYLPTTIEEDELANYVQMCKQKEQYGQKVRKGLRSALDQCARMWVYLDSIGKLADYKAYYADLRLDHETQRAQAKAQETESHRQVVTQQAEAKEQQKFQDAQAREEFASSSKERHYESRQGRLQSRQTLLDDRFVNSGVYYHR
jgi:hypothetical protein